MLADMPDRPINYHIIHLWIDLTRALMAMASPDIEQFGTNLGDLLVRSAVYIGTVERRPMTVSKLCAYVGIPRGSVIRRLRDLERQGLVERSGTAWCTPKARMEMLHDFEAASRLVRATAKNLPRVS